MPFAHTSVVHGSPSLQPLSAVQPPEISTTASTSSRASPPSTPAKSEVSASLASSEPTAPSVPVASSTSVPGTSVVSSPHAETARTRTAKVAACTTERANRRMDPPKMAQECKFSRICSPGEAGACQVEHSRISRAVAKRCSHSFTIFFAAVLAVPSARLPPKRAGVAPHPVPRTSAPPPASPRHCQSGWSAPAPRT